MNITRRYRSFDFLLFTAACGLVIFGIILIGSATLINTEGPSKEYQMQQIFFAAGVVLMLVSAFVDYHFIAKFYIAIYIGGVLLLILVLFLDRDSTSGVSRWIMIGKIGIQPSEFMKIFIILGLSGFLFNIKERLNEPRILAAIIALTAIPTVLIIRQPSLSASMVTMVIAAGMLYAGGLSYKYIFGALIAVLPVSIFGYFDLLREEPLIVDKIFAEYQLTKIQTFINPIPGSDQYFQTNNSIHAIGSGLLNGKGLYGGTVNQMKYLPESQNDFIFSVIGEEFGFLGCMLVLGVMFIIILKCVLIAHKACDTLGKLIASGVAIMLAFQVFVNVGVATGIMPNTGMPFPFMSSGGSSLLVCMIAIGLAINVGMSKQKSLFEG